MVLEISGIDEVCDCGEEYSIFQEANVLIEAEVNDENKPTIEVLQHLYIYTGTLVFVA